MERLPGHPLFGHLGRFRSDRIPMLQELKERDIVELPMGPLRRVIVVSAPALANEVLVSKAASFRKSHGLSIFLRPVLGNGLLTSETKEHERARRLLAPAFAHKRIAAYADTMATRSASLVKKLKDDSYVDVADAMMHLTFEIVGKTLFDAEVTGDANVVGDALTVAMEVAMGQLGALVPVPPQIPTPSNLRYKRAVARLDEVMYRIIRERRAAGGDRGDVLSMLLSTKDEDGSSLDDRQVRDEAMTLFLAGHETTANALAWTFYLLDRHPEIRAKLEDELDALGHDPTYEDLKKLPYTMAVFKEAMRLYPPAYVLGRRPIEDVEIGGASVQKDSIVLVNIAGLHRRAEVWPNADVFDPERFLGDREKQLPRGAYMPFGSGPRVCIGNHFALMEGQILLATIARSVRFNVARKEVALDPLVTLRPKNGIPARIELRSKIAKGVARCSDAPAVQA